ncbi:precorrin-2 dehydrogenase/sirohydrochlorin ferrochelatase family protein [Staphylococcus edaphicus]|uniref:precorrin-2 dehydrogenase n=1 Tax=Staphylococcus edaphicus TaxID=1955013 RepID=A0A2C6VH47_9STAP|nr:NAD(P)-dependent oxidoreductase [Staphylococcus edaphicus]PHK49601.1 preprotein translocase subunit TatB [Staphylococcus edaphicus]UQW82034.1 bifunctional precorrin-2 dehydrogenase/sirohydrochlorin ferrochelatase [Staphylococcus edaphicus]
MYPVQLNLMNKNIVIIGGGTIAYRKAKNILKENPQSLTIISKKFLPEFFELEHHNFKLITKCYDKHDIQHADLVIAATNHQSINNQIKDDAKSTQWVNHCGDKAQSDFFNMLEITYENIKINFRSEGQDYNKMKKMAQAVERFLTEFYEEENSCQNKNL